LNAISFGLVLFGVLLNAAAQLLLKAGTNSIGHFAFDKTNILPVGWQLATEPHILGGLTCYVVSVVVWIMALSRVEVSIAYPMLSIGYVVNAAAAYYLFGEAVTPMRLLGIYIVARS
jgi:multidrug transporter EmrE-like cation transporter